MDSIRGLKTYMPFARNIFQKLISYKANVIMFIFGDGLMLAVSYYLWRAIYDSADNKIINGFTANEMILYVFISFLTSLMTSVDISYDISDEVKSGSIAINLIRPISYEKRMFFQGIGNAFYNLVVIFIPAFIIVNIMAYNY